MKDPADDVVVRSERSESVQECSVIRYVNQAAFGTSEEGDLVDNLRGSGEVLISLVAEVGNRIVGHILFSRMWIEIPCGLVAAVALAPMAVLPEYQRRNIGGRMIRYGLDLLKAKGEKIVIVVGHPDYYPRFGFSAQKAHLLEGPFPRDAFMAMELSPGALDGICGRVTYPAAFGL